MSDWDNLKAEYQRNRDLLDGVTTDENLARVVNGMNANILNYTNRAGISRGSDADPAVVTVNTNLQAIQTTENAYVTINSILSKGIKELSSSADIEGKLKLVGQIQQDIKKLKKEVNDAKHDSDTAKTRQSSIEEPQTKLSMYQGFGARIGFVKPLYQTSIPFLLGFGVLFLFLSGLILREFFLPELGSSTSINSEGGSSLFAIFTDSRFLAVSAGMAFIIAILFILSFSGYLGKNVR
jgi:hypothetical protein